MENYLIIKKTGHQLFVLLLLISFNLFQVSCKKLVEVDGPVTSINAGNVYSNELTAAAVLTGIYTKLSNENRGLAGLPSLFLYAGLSADELNLYDLSNTRYLDFYRNTLSSQSSSASFWNWIYPYVFYANSAIEGLTVSNGLRPSVKQQLIGEAKFIRAFCYFHLVNIYGDVGLTTSTDWNSNGLLVRKPQSEVWQQIILDLNDAKDMLSSDFMESDAVTTKASTSRVRPSKWAAEALLARAYLYSSEWAKAETHATLVINNTLLFDTVSLNNGVFNKDSKEAIWQLQPTGNGRFSNSGEGKLFVLPSSGPDGEYPVVLSNNVVSSFESNDKRKLNWIDSVVVYNSPNDSTIYYYPFKYKIGAVNTSTSEYIMILRLAEQYLIRAEARARQDKIAEAKADLDVIRKRAGLPNTTANDRNSLIDTILHERQVELFTEWGHRWLDLKRAGIVDGVMTTVAPQKGGTWNSNWQWYPIPITELQKNPNLVQNSGY